jgi:hypothetical protein
MVGQTARARSDLGQCVSILVHEHLSTLSLSLPTVLWSEPRSDPTQTSGREACRLLVVPKGNRSNPQGLGHYYVQSCLVQAAQCGRTLCGDGDAEGTTGGYRRLREAGLVVMGCTGLDVALLGRLLGPRYRRIESVSTIEGRYSWCWFQVCQVWFRRFTSIVLELHADVRGMTHIRVMSYSFLEALANAHNLH